MSREIVNLICAEFPGAEPSSRGGHDAWTVGAEPFAVLDPRGSGVDVRAENPAAARAGGTAASDLGPPWVALPFGLPEGELRHRIADSYAMACKALPPELQARLDQTSG